MSLPSVFNPMGALMKELWAGEILRTNEEAGKYGLMLTAEEASELVEARSQLLQSYGRVELDTGTAVKLIHSFCSSPFIGREDYASSIKELQEIFYYLKNETEDEIGDDRLIEVMKELLDGSCGGSIELLRGRELEEFIRDYRLKRGMNDFYRG